MIRRFLKFLQLPFPDQWLLIEVILLLGAVRLALLTIPFRYLAKFLGRNFRESSAEESLHKAEIERMRWAIRTMSDHTPWKSKCLVQAITGKILLRQCGLDNTLYLGLAKDEADAMIAHAWLRCGQEVVTGGSGGTYTVVAKFADFWISERE